MLNKTLVTPSLIHVERLSNDSLSDWISILVGEALEAEQMNVSIQDVEASLPIHDLLSVFMELNEYRQPPIEKKEADDE